MGWASQLEPASEHSSKSSGSSKRYSLDDVASWRAAYRFPRWFNSLSEFGYTDDELLLWREAFDNLADECRISSIAFEAFLSQKYSGAVTSSVRRAQKVERFCTKFRKRGFLDFGEF